MHFTWSIISIFPIEICFLIRFFQNGSSLNLLSKVQFYLTFPLQLLKKHTILNDFSIASFKILLSHKEQLILPYKIHQIIIEYVKNPKYFQIKDAMAIIMRKNFDVIKIVRQQMFHMECDLF